MERGMTTKDTLRLTDLPNRAQTRFLQEPDGAARAALAEVLGIPGIRKLRFAGTLRPEGRRDWVLEGELGATVVQSCVVTLEPVTTRIDEPVLRRYVSEMPEFPEGAEVEMPEDDTIEPLPEIIDLAAVMVEALTLALPSFPRAPGAELGEAVFAAPGEVPMTDAEARPFAALASLRDALKKDDEGA